MLGLLGRKIGMTQIFGEDGSFIPVTVIEAGPCTIVQKKTKDTDGYDAVQVGFGKRKPQRVAKALRTHFEKKNLAVSSYLREFRTEKASSLEVGQQLNIAAFKIGDIVDVEGTSKGRGFQGVIKRHGKHGGPMSHGSDFHRRTGSIGMRTWPGRVFKNTRLPGHYGDEKVTTRNLEVAGVRPEDNVILIHGSVPGSANGYVVVINRTPDFENRADLTVGTAKAAAKTEKAEAANAAPDAPKEETQANAEQPPDTATNEKKE